MKGIPVLDFKGESELQLAFETAIRDFSGVYLINHGIPEKLMRNAFNLSSEFFQLSNEIKLSYQKIGSEGDDYHGFTRSAVERLVDNNNVQDSSRLKEYREAFDICGNKRFFPDDEVPGFEETMTSLESELISLFKRVGRMLAIFLGEERDSILEKCKNVEGGVEGKTSLRCLFYPKLAEIPEGTTRCNPHTDMGLFTLLLQDEIGGLMVKLKNGRWIPVTPKPGGILLITGHLWECMTGLPALVHRVDFPEDDDKKLISRYSMTYFVHLDADEKIGKDLKTVREITDEKAEKEKHSWHKDKGEE